MLIVGDASTQQIDREMEVDTIEILVNKNKVDFLLDELGLTGSKDYVEVNTLATLYYTTSKKTYLIIETGNNIFLKTLIKRGQAQNSLRIATPALNYAYMWAMPNLKFDSASLWLKKVRQVDKLEPYFYKTYRNERDHYKLLMCGKKITYFMKSFNYISSMPYSHMSFEKYQKYDILAAITDGDKNPPYKRMTLPHKDHYYIETVFKGNGLTDSERFIAAMQKIYLDLINETFIIDKACDKKWPDRIRWKSLFIDTIMCIIAANKDPLSQFIRTYIRENIEALIAGFNPAILEEFIEAVNNGQLTKNKTWDLD